jgi:hypothetical protein
MRDSYRSHENKARTKATALASGMPKKNLNKNVFAEGELQGGAKRSQDKIGKG